MKWRQRENKLLKKLRFFKQDQVKWTEIFAEKIEKKIGEKKPFV
jgi:hypothetical protein